MTSIRVMRLLKILTLFKCISFLPFAFSVYVSPEQDLKRLPWLCRRDTRGDSPASRTTVQTSPDEEGPNAVVDGIKRSVVNIWGEFENVAGGT